MCLRRRLAQLLHGVESLGFEHVLARELEVLDPLHRRRRRVSVLRRQVDDQRAARAIGEERAARPSRIHRLATELSTQVGRGAQGEQMIESALSTRHARSERHLEANQLAEQSAPALVVEEPVAAGPKLELAELVDLLPQESGELVAHLLHSCRRTLREQELGSSRLELDYCGFVRPLPCRMRIGDQVHASSRGVPDLIELNRATPDRRAPRPEFGLSDCSIARLRQRLDRSARPRRATPVSSAARRAAAESILGIVLARYASTAD